MHVLEAQGLTRRAGGRVLVDRAGLHVDGGEIVVVSGPSGSGKTSLLRLLCRLDEPDAGSLRFLGEDALRMPAPVLRRRVGYLHQRPDFPPGTVRHQLGTGPRLRGEEPPDETVEGMLETLGLERVSESDTRRLSTGERHRTALGRLLLNRPDVLLLDEPTANLDADTVRRAEEAIRAAADRGAAVLVVSHDAVQGQRLADRHFRMLAGRLS